MRLRTFAATMVMTAVLSGLPPSRMSAAQPERRPVPAPAQVVPDAAAFDRDNANETREKLHEILRNYPPSLSQVLRLDPSLLTNPVYLAPYPQLAAYLAQHPSVAHNPGFFLGTFRFENFEDTNRRQSINALEDILLGVGIFLFFMAALVVIAYIGRSVLEHRRWLLVTKTQTDAHTKLVDRLASNEELLNYIQSPAGQRFLTAAPLVPDPDGRLGIPAAPIGRILNSVQIGIVGAFGGLGLWIAKARVVEEAAQPLHVIAVLALALGLGFVVSALVSYGMSRQLGLIRHTTPVTPDA